ncbi:hypothetical protein D3C83_241990 [compost metagenome]
MFAPVVTEVAKTSKSTMCAGNRSGWRQLATSASERMTDDRSRVTGSTALTTFDSMKARKSVIVKTS